MKSFRVILKKLDKATEDYTPLVTVLAWIVGLHVIWAHIQIRHSKVTGEPPARLPFIPMYKLYKELLFSNENNEK